MAFLKFEIALSWSNCWLKIKPILLKAVKNFGFISMAFSKYFKALLCLDNFDLFNQQKQDILSQVEKYFTGKCALQA